MQPQPPQHPHPYAPPQQPYPQMPAQMQQAGFAPQPEVIPVPAVAFTCPKCRTPTTPSGEPQKCANCGLRYLLVSGHAGDHATPIPDPATNSVALKIKTSGMFLMHQVELERFGFAWGDLDPVLGVARMSTQKLPYPHVCSLAAWRPINVPRLVFNAIVGVPLTLMFTVLAITESPGNWIMVILLGTLTAIGLYGALGRRMLKVRIVGPTGEKEVVMRRQGARGPRFIREAFRRVSGLQNAPVP